MAQDPLNNPPKTYEELFERTANDAGAWLASAEGLAAAGEAVKRDDDNTGGAKLLADKGTLTPKRSVYVMLLGYAIECALKGLLAKAGKAPGTAAGTLERRFKTHKLGDLADAARVSLSAAEKETLVWLSCYVEYMGRYPIPTKWDRWMDEPAIGFALEVDASRTRTRVRWSEAEHLATAEAIFAKLAQDLKSP